MSLRPQLTVQEVIDYLEDLKSAHPFVDGDTLVEHEMDGSGPGDYAVTEVRVEQWLDSARVVLS